MVAYLLCKVTDSCAEWQLCWINVCVCPYYSWTICCLLYTVSHTDSRKYAPSTGSKQVCISNTVTVWYQNKHSVSLKINMVASSAGRVCICSCVCSLRLLRQLFCSKGAVHRKIINDWNVLTLRLL